MVDDSNKEDKEDKVNEEVNNEEVEKWEAREEVVGGGREVEKEDMEEAEEENRKVRRAAYLPIPWKRVSLVACRAEQPRWCLGLTSRIAADADADAWPCV